MTIEVDTSTKFSPSKLATYKECPRRYQFRYIDRMPRGASTVEAFLGTCVHKAVETLYEKLQTGRTMSLGETVAVFEAEWAAGWTPGIVSHDPSISPDDWKVVGRRCVENYYQQWHPFDRDRTIGIERRVGFPLVVDQTEYRLEGFIDRLAISNTDEAFEIHDIKTAKTLPAQQHVDADWQLALYEIAVRHQWPDTAKVRLIWHYVRHGKSLSSQRTGEQLRALAQEAGAVIGRIKSDHEFAPKRSALCDWCEYKPICPLFAHGEKLSKLDPAIRSVDEGRRAVDELQALDDEKKSLRAKIKDIEAREEVVEQSLIGFAQKNDFQAVSGTHSDAVIRVKEEYKFPTKTGEPEKAEALEGELLGMPMWGNVSHFDSRRFLEGYKSKTWPADWIKAAEGLLTRYAQRIREINVRLRRRRDADD